VARLTAPGAGALTSFRLCGTQAWEILRRLAGQTGRRLPVQPTTGQLFLCRMGSESGEQVVVSIKQTSPWPDLELHCHGGKEVGQLVLEELEACGACRTEWHAPESSWVANRFQADAVQALVQACTTRTAGILLDQVSGSFLRALEQILRHLDNNEFKAVQARLEELEHLMPVGLHLTRPFQVVVAGAPNVGKSSLVNALAGYSRCIVSPQPGTTRDLVTVTLAINGWPVELIDTAGRRLAHGRVEEEGVSLARLAVRAADLCLWVLDGSEPPTWPDPDTRTKLILNKTDLPPGWPHHEAAGAVHVSARSGTGLEEVLHLVATVLVPDPPPPGAAVPFTGETRRLVQECARLARDAAYPQVRDLVANFLDEADSAPA
jgi:tRNA modification GTPase